MKRGVQGRKRKNSQGQPFVYIEIPSKCATCGKDANVISCKFSRTLISILPFRLNFGSSGTG